MNMKRTIKLAPILGLTLLAWSAPAAEVKELWDKHCVSCHAKDGSGNTKMGRKSGVKDYRDAKVQAELKDDKGLQTVKAGITEKGQERMKPYADKLTDDEIKSLITYMRTFKAAQ
jgi:mono/diheme cytochrome c family protein